MAGDEAEFMDKAKIEDYRHAHESLTEWKLRRTFLQSHAETHELDRLLCLASCFINVECYGCKYSALLMAELRELAQDMREQIDEHREKIQSHRKMEFVKASDDKGKGDEKKGVGGRGTAGLRQAHSIAFVASTQSESTQERAQASVPTEDTISVQGRDGGSEAGPSARQSVSSLPSTCHVTSLGAVTSKSSDAENALKGFAASMLSLQHQSNRDPDKRDQGRRDPGKQYQRDRDSAMELKFATLVYNLREAKSLNKNAVETVHVAATKSKMAANPMFITATKPGQFVCQLSIDCITVATGEAPNKKLAKHHAFEKALELLLKPRLQVIILEDGNRKLEWPQQYQPAQTAPLPGPSSPSAHHVPGGVNPRKRASASSLPPALASFILVEPQYKPDTLTAVSILHRSASFNKVALEFDFSEKMTEAMTFQVRCRLLIGGDLVADVGEETKQKAKNLAAETAVRKLRETSWTMQIKKKKVPTATLR